MAAVFLCEDERLERKVAVKRLHSESPEETALRFQREARIGASLNHPNVVSIYDTVTDEEDVLIVMEYVEGETLGRLIEREGRLDPRRAVEVLRGAAAALDHAHEEGVVHRDVKPANVLIGRDGEVKLVDLGIATALEGTRITRADSVLGTPAYMAPDQIDGADAGPAADVYALATVAFEALSGRPAHAGRNAVEIARRVVAEPPPRLSDAWPQAPREATEVLARGMAKDPAARPRSAGELVDELARALDAAPTPERTDWRLSGAMAPKKRQSPDRASRDRPGWLLPVIALLALVALLAVAAAVLSSGDDGGEGERQEEARGKSGSGGGREGGAAQPPRSGSPEAAVQTFYTRSANDDFEGAWELATPAFQRQLGGYDAFVAQQSSLESIEFRKLRANGEEVEIETVATHTDRVDECEGSLRVVQGEAGWLIDRAESIQCRPQ